MNVSNKIDEYVIIDEQNDDTKIVLKFLLLQIPVVYHNYLS